MIVPLPFTRIVYLYGEPMIVPRDGDVEEWRVTIEQTLNELADRAETEFEMLWRQRDG